MFLSTHKCKDSIPEQIDISIENYWGNKTFNSFQCTLLKNLEIRNKRCCLKLTRIPLKTDLDIYMFYKLNFILWLKNQNVSYSKILI